MTHTVMVLVGPEYDEQDLWYCRYRLEEAGYEVRLAGLGEEEYYGRWGMPCVVDGHVADFPALDLVGLVVPGGWAADRLRRDPRVVEHARDIDAHGGLLAAIDHGAWVFASAGLVRGRRLTSTVGIRDDLVNAGADWIHAPVVVDGNLVTGRLSRDLPAFGLAMVQVLDARYAGSVPGT